MLEVASGALRLVDLPTGAVLHETAGREGVPILLLDGLALFRSIDASSVWAASVADGRVTWSKNLLGDMSTALGAHDPYGVLGVAADGSGCAVVAYGSCLFGVSTSDGSILWGRPLEVPYRAPQARDGRVYVWSTSVSAETTTFDLSTGEVRREPQAGTTNRLVILDKTTGRVLLDRDLSEHGPEFAARQRPEYPAVGCDHIVFTTDAGLLAAFRLSDGELVWKHKLGVQPFEATVAGHEIYVPCADGTLLVFECEDGEL
jgi:outer membrane protein assembly factor BamB